MAVICFADGGSGATGHLAARLVKVELASMGAAATVYGCGDGAHWNDGDARTWMTIGNTAPAPVTGRQFIEDMRRLKSSYQHLIVDVSGAADHTAALAFGLADLTLIPLRPHDFEPAAIIKTLELLEILSGHRRKSLRHAVFLAGRAETLEPAIHLQISGLLIRRGVTTLPVFLCEQTADAVVKAQSQARARAFAQSVIAHLVAEAALEPPMAVLA